MLGRCDAMAACVCTCLRSFSARCGHFKEIRVKLRASLFACSSDPGAGGQGASEPRAVVRPAPLRHRKACLRRSARASS
eukprot:2266815-Rhodomonas_salina.2